MLSSSKTTYFAPYDDCKAALLAFIRTAQKSIRIADYSFNMTELVDLLILKHKDKVDVSLVLDRSQSGGSSEKDPISRLQSAGIDVAIGTSDKHRIMHLKVAIVDGQAVAFGSYNFTEVAELESNVLRVEQDTQVAAMFLANWQQTHDWIIQNEGVK